MKNTIRLFIYTSLLSLAPVLLLAQSIDMAKQAARTNHVQNGNDARELEDLIVSHAYTDPSTGVQHVYFRQKWLGVPVFPGVFGVHLNANGALITANKAPVNGKDLKGVKATASLTAQQALQQVAQNEDVVLDGLQLDSQDPAAQRTTFSVIGWTDMPFAEKVWFQKESVLHMAWHVDLPVPGGAHWWSIVLDANNGTELSRFDRVVSCSFEEPERLNDHAHPDEVSGNASPEPPTPSPLLNGYNVFPLPLENPNDGPRTIVNDPWNIALNASPFGWHDTDGIPGAEFTDTRGNNVHAQSDTLAQDPTQGYTPDGGATLDFDAPLDLSQEPGAYLDAAIINLFYWNNVCHDVAYQYGFDEPAGNFQMNNYGNGGTDGDFVWADAQDGSGTSNANFYTPPDGENPRMQMYRWDDTTPERDSDLDNGIIAHEYGHGISMRLVGGAMSVDCLSNADQMGEGWSDYFGLMLTMKPGDLGNDPRGIGTYVIGEPLTGTGIRPAPYSTDTLVNDHTYASTNDNNISYPHGIGFVWCTMLWEMTWNLIAEYGYDADVYNGMGGNNRALHIVFEGMKLAPCSPGFVDARDAILTANQILYNGESDSLIWAAFARRGLGYSAYQGLNHVLRDQTEAFDLQPQNDLNIQALLSPEPSTVPECALGIVAVECIVRNGGQNPQLNFSLYYQVDNGPIGSKFYFGTLAPGSSVVVQFSGQIGLQLPVGDHIIKVWSGLSGDQVPSNDTLTSTLTVISAGYEFLPYFEDFELETTGSCQVLPLQSEWYNVPNGPEYIDDAHDFGPGNGDTYYSGSSWDPPEIDYTSGTTNGMYLFTRCSSSNNSRKATLISECFSLQNATAPKFRFAYWMQEGSLFSIDIDVWQNGKWHDLSGTPIFEDVGKVWRTISLPLDDFIGSNIAIRIRSHQFYTPITIDALEVIDTYQPLTVAIGVARDSVCAGEVIKLLDLTQNPDPLTDWTWNITPSDHIYVNGTDMYSPAPEIILLDTGHYEVELIGYNGYDTDTTMLVGGIEQITGKEHTVVVRTDAYGYEFTWQVRTTGGTVLASGGPYDFMPLGTHLQPVETFCLPDDGCYELVLNDPTEGICCLYGNGKIELFDPMGRTLVQTTMMPSDSPQLVVPFCSPGNCASIPWIDTMESGENGWIQNEDDDRDWWLSNTSPSFGSPPGDHTTGAGYYWRVSPLPVSETEHKKAILSSPCLDLSGITAPMLSFWVYAKATDSIMVSIESQGQLFPYVWQNLEWITNNWKQIQIDLSPFQGEPVKLHFVVNKKPNSVYSIGLDDVEITAAEGIKFKVIMALEGPYDSGANLMDDDLRAQGVIPHTEPFTDLGYTHMDDGGGEQLNPSLLGLLGPKAIVDWVIVELRDGNDFDYVLATKSALLQRDGTVIDHSGNEELGFSKPEDAYVIAVRHRNHLGAMMASEDDIEPPIKTFDFTTSDINFTYGTEGRKMIAGTGVLWAGDANGDGSIRYTGFSNDRDLILQAIGGTVPTNTVSGYHQEDLNMDGIIKYTGVANDRDIILQNIGGTVPTNVRNEQFP